MLKIKDSVDLKELEKYGFDTSASPDVQGIDKIDFTNNWVDDNFGMIIGHGWLVYDSTREIIGWDLEPNLDTLFQLIIDGLIEKI